MREFKFIRGIYKNENILNQYETKDTLFALYKNGSPVSLEVKNDEEFQKTIIGLDSDKREIYTIRPSQFEFAAEKQDNGGYTFTYNLNRLVYDTSREFPENVKNAAKSYLSENITVDMPNNPSLIFHGSEENPTQVKLLFKDRPSFNKSLYFRVSGAVEEFTIVDAHGIVTTAYKALNNTVDFNDILNNRMFFEGILQEKVQPERMDVVIENITVDEKNCNDLGIASKYITKGTYKFVYDNKLTNIVPYNDDLTFKLYKKVDEYLISADREDAVKNNTLKKGYVAYANECPDDCCYYEDGDECKPAYEFLKENYLQENSVLIEDTDYSFYQIIRGDAYIFVEDCNVTKNRSQTTIVKGYATSYSGAFIIDTIDKVETLRQIKEDDLTITEIYVYEADTYRIIDGSAYENDPNYSEYRYKMLSYNDEKAITKDNVVVIGDNVAPKQEDNVFRQIKNVCITATES